jgi:hypothetical protein
MRLRKLRKLPCFEPAHVSQKHNREPAQVLRKCSVPLIGGDTCAPAHGECSRDTQGPKTDLRKSPENRVATKKAAGLAPTARSFNTEVISMQSNNSTLPSWREITSVQR